MMTPDRRNDDSKEQPLHQLQLPLELHLKLRPLPLPLPPPPPPPSTPTQISSDSSAKISAATTTEMPSRKATRSVAGNNQFQSFELNELIASTSDQGRDSATWREAKRVLLLNSNPSVAQRVDKRALVSTQDSLALETRPSFSRVEALEAEQQQEKHRSAPKYEDQQRQHQASMNDGNQRLGAFSAALLPLIWPMKPAGLTSDATNQQAMRVIEAPKTHHKPGSSTAGTAPSDKLSQLVELSLTPASDVRQPRRRRKNALPAYLQQVSSSTTPYPDSFRMASRYPMPRIKFSGQQTHQQSLAANQVQQNSARAITGKRLVAKQQQQLQQKRNKLAKQKKKVNYQPFESSPTIVADKHRVAHQDDPKQPGSDWQLSSLPAGLSKLIEDKLFQNVTNFLMSRINANNKNHTTQASVVKLNSPTTSVSRVVNVIGSARKIVGASKELDEAAKAQSPERLAEAALTIANAASDAWRQSNLTLEDLRTMINPNSSSNTTPKPLSTTTKSTTLPPTTTTPTVEAQSTTTQASSTADGAGAARVLEQTTTTTEKPRIERERVAGVQYQSSDEQARVAGKSRPEQAETSTVNDDSDSDEGSEMDILRSNNKRTTTRNDRVKKTSMRRDFSAPRGRQQQKSMALVSSNNSNIKLFHFKRKPDVNKLPFYRKPLNYTELGWSNEQIQEHQDFLASLGLPLSELANSTLGAASELASSDATMNNNVASASSSDSGESIIQLETREQQMHLQSQQLRDRVDKQQDKFHLLKRKRRGGRTSQFDKLMADLHSGLQSSSPTTSLNHADSNHANQPNQQQDQQLELSAPLVKSNELVPTLRKKPELLVMKPILMHAMLNQSRTTTTQRPEQQQQDETSSSSLASSKQPIVRTRRKNAQHHEQHEHRHQASPPANGWRPMSGENNGQSGSSVSVGEQLMLVPSGLLTPSGSHLIPLIARAPEHPQNIDTVQDHKLLSQFVSWKAARNNHNNLQAQQQFAPQPSTMLELDIPASLVNGSIEIQQQQQQASDIVAKQPTPSQPSAAAAANDSKATSSGEFRVPKLLVKPMRPAKYSLNGYIPKPSLSHPTATTHGIHTNTDRESNNSNNQQSTTLKSSQGQSKPQPQQQQQATTTQQNHNHNNNNRDLDSSTSNEIFSRRRGLNQSPENTSQPNALQQQQQQQYRAKLEENKRKYMLLSSQQEHKINRSPTLSTHKANLIRAKLGLVPKMPTAPINTNKLEQAQQATTNSITHSNPGASSTGSSPFPVANQQHRRQVATASDGESDESGVIVAQQQQAVSGSISSGIPKTDFECADSQGKFVSGLFADYKTKCQVWHLCSNNRKYSFLCPGGTVFNTKSRICDWRYNVKCDAESTLPRYQVANNNKNNSNEDD